jgi:hypothetical protein
MSSCRMVDMASMGSKELTGVDRLQSEFVARGTTKGLDTSCIQAIHR